MEKNDAEEKNSKELFQSLYFNLLEELWYYWKKLDCGEGTPESGERY